MKYKRIAEPIATTELCSYGCGQVAKYKNGSGKLMCCDRATKCPELRRKNSLGGKKAYATGLRPEGWSHLTPEQRASTRGKFTADFSYGGKGSHKKVLLLERGHKCECCSLTEWLDRPITLELEHSDGDRENNTKDNLKLLCPNCHSQTPTWKRGKLSKRPNTKYGATVTDDVLLQSLLQHKTIKDALEYVGLSGKGWIYARCYRLLSDHNMIDKNARVM